VYICPDCLVTTPVGAKCRSCASQKGNRLFTLTPLQALAGIATGLLAGAVAGWGVEFGGIFRLFIAFAYGGFAGDMIMRAAGRTRGTKMEILAGVSITVGALAGRLILAATILFDPNQVRPPHGILAILTALVYPSPILLIAVIITVAAAVSRIRYM